MTNKNSFSKRAKKKSAKTKPNLKERLPHSGLKFRFTLTGLAAVFGGLIIWFFFFRNIKPDFDGNRAFRDLVKQVDYGPRIVGTIGHENTLKFLAGELKKYTNLVNEQTFTFKDRHDTSKIYHGTNIVASFNPNPEIKERVLLCAHWDSRPFADQDPDTSKQKLPVPAANDGASGVAVLLEMARLFKTQSPSIGVDIVFFDLEDIGDGVKGAPDSTDNPFGIGSEKFVEQNPGYRPAFGILLDMVGDKNLSLPKELASVSNANNIVDKVWRTAKKVGAKAFKNENGFAVTDDHIPFLKKYIPVIDVIQMPFPNYWHTTNDTPDKCSAESLRQVGDVLVEVIYSEK